MEWIRDVAYLARKQQDRLDWDQVLELAAASGARRVVHLAILLAEEHLPGGIPARVVEQAGRDRGARRLAAQVRWNLEHVEGDFAGTPAGAWMQMRMFETWGGGLRYLGRRLLLPNQIDATELSLPAALRPLFWVLRPFRIFTKALRQVVHR